EVDLRGGIVLDRVPAVKTPAAREESGLDPLDSGEIEGPETHVYEVDPEVHDAPAAGERWIEEPGLIGAVGVVEDEVGSVHLSDLTATNQTPGGCEGGGEAVGEVHPEESVGAACGGNHGANFRRRP